MLGRIGNGVLRVATLGYYGSQSKPEPTLNDLLLEAQIENMHKFDEGDQPAPAPATSEVDELKALLQREIEEIHRQRETWAERLRILNRIDAVHADHVHQADCTKEMNHKTSGLKEALKKLASFFHSAKTEMDGQLREEMDVHILALEGHLEHLMDKVNKTELSSDEHRDALMHLSNAAIILLGELDRITTNFSSEIEECVKDEELLEQKAQVLVNAGIYYIQNLLNILIPPIEIQFGEEYLNYLGRELEGPEDRFIEGVAQAQGMLDKAGTMVEGYLQQHRAIEFAVRSRKVDEAVKGFANSMSMFAGNAVNQAHHEQAQDEKFEQDVRAFINM